MSSTSGCSRFFWDFFEKFSSIITKTNDRNLPNRPEISSLYSSLQAITSPLALPCQNPSNSSAIFIHKSLWISITTISHNKGRHETESCTNPNDHLWHQMGRTSWRRLRKKKSNVKKPPRYIITPQKNRVKSICNPDATALFLPFPTINPYHSTRIEFKQCPHSPGGSLGRAILILREKMNF